MLKIATLFVIFACLTTAFAINATLTKNFFFVNAYNSLSYKLFHTTNGIIAYNLEYSPKGAIPQYLLLDPVEGYVTPILEDILSSCGHFNNGVFDRLKYHVQTSNLVYFCTANNSLLILDEKTYAVKDAISTGISANFSEAKLTSDGTSLYVLLMGVLYQQNQIPSQLVQFDLSARTIVTSLVFDQGLNTEEYINGFVSQNSDAYVLANTIESDQTTITIYSISLTDNSYVLTKVKDFTNGGNSLSQLHQLGNFLAMNNDDELNIFDSQGNIAVTYSIIATKNPAINTVSNIPAIVSQEGSLDLYVLTNGEELFKFTVQDDAIHNETIATGFDFQIAYGNRYTSDLLLTIDESQSNFNIVTLQNSELIYSMPTAYDDFVITNSTFGVMRLGLLKIFNRQTNALIGNVSVPRGFHLQADSDTLYFTETGSSYNTCVLKKLDLITLSVVDIKEYPIVEFCEYAISQFKISANGNPEFVVLSYGDNKYYIVTEAHGIVEFDGAEYLYDAEYVVPDYDTLSVYRLQYNKYQNLTTVYTYEYNGTSFTLETSYDIEDSKVSSFYSSGNQKAFAFSKGYLKIIDLEFGSATQYSLPTITKMVSSFQDNQGRKHLILSDIRQSGDWDGDVTQPSLFDFNGVSPVPGANRFTVQAGAASGLCSYWLADGYLSSVGLIKFYDACTQEEHTSMFSILQ